jgi:phage terminase large subunit-like protein
LALLPRIDSVVLEGLSPAKRKQARELIEALESRRRSNPLEFFEPHSVAQREFMAASTKVVAAFAGNRFGKTTSLVVRALMECVDRAVLPGVLAGWKRFDAPAYGWIVCPTTDKIYDSMIPAFRKWVPDAQLLGGEWAKAWSKERRQLSFANGSQISFKTYEQDASTLGGAALHFVGYDEPPPREHREECLTRLLDYGGYEMFAMTPLKTNTGWIRRDIFKNREAPHITVVRGSMHDNPLLDEETKQIALATYANDAWRRAREFGDFVSVGGVIYSDFERWVREPWSGRMVRGWDPAVAIDPGIRNAAILWGGFDDDNVCRVFDERLLQDKDVSDYALAVWLGNAKWGIGDNAERRRAIDWVRAWEELGELAGNRDALCRLLDVPRNGEEPLYVIDPAAKSRGQVNAESVKTALARFEIFCLDGQNAVETGVSQIRDRGKYGRLEISRDCAGLRDEADEYAAEDRPDGEFKPIKENDHRMDALRYLCMSRPWDPIVEEQAPARVLGKPRPLMEAWRPPRRAEASPPLGGMT